MDDASDQSRCMVEGGPQTNHTPVIFEGNLHIIITSIQNLRIELNWPYTISSLLQKSLKMCVECTICIGRCVDR